MSMPLLLCWLGALFPLVPALSHAGGYADVAVFRGRTIAVGTGGRIDCILPSGEIVRVDSSCRHDLHSVFSSDSMLIVAGDQGTILISSDGKNFCPAQSGTRKNIRGIASAHGVFVAGADGGTLLASADGKSWKSIPAPVRGNIVSMTANASSCIGVSDSGEILMSADGRSWEVQDYNREYAGYSPRTQFRKILAAPSRFVIVGVHEDGSPSILTSSLGKVWAERPLMYKDDQGSVASLTVEPNGIAYDPEHDEFLLACDQGGLMSLPPCVECSRYATIGPTDLRALACTDSTLVIVGDGFSVFTVQHNIRSAQ